MPPVVARSRQEQKLRTRRALLDAALRLLEHQSFDGLGLREVAREAGLAPAGFYRHFTDLEELGLVLVEESFGSLREMIRSARADPDTYVHVVRSSAEILVRTVQQDRAHFRFIARERYSGVTALRQAIRGEIRLFASELATDLAHFPYLRDWSTEDLGLIAHLIVTAMVAIAEAVLDAPPDRPDVEAALVHDAETQLRMIMVGGRDWRSAGVGRPSRP